ncbi:restriction endonuclease subunit S, partial [Ligilactobacillus salivarius]|uniref:restriction endonuclease subunit S n=1 Tax=Ligilactobacillus salivarius TaxID=1624 RepID=UPI000665618D
PEVRYKNFSDAWEQRKLGEVMDVGSVKRIHQSDWKTEGVRFLRARDIVSFSKNEKPSDLLYIDNSKYNEYSKISGKVQKGDLLVTGVGSIGVPMLIKSDDPIYFKDGNIIWFKNNNSLNGNFFYYSFTSNKIQNFIRKSSGAGTVGTYTIDNGKKTPILIPKDIDEQEKVGKFLSRFDALITLH